MKKLVLATAAVIIGLAGLTVGPVVGADAATGGYALVKGTILKETGNPLTKTRITVGVGDCETPGGCGADSVVTVRTDAGGHYSARVLVTSNPSVYVSVPAKGPYSSRASGYITIAAGKTYTKNLTVRKETMIVGKVVDASGAPIKAAVIAYSAKNNAVGDRDVTVPAEGGYFHLALPAGAYKIRLSVNTTPGAAGGVVTTWYGAKTKDAATIVRVTAGTNQRAKIVFTP